MKKLKLGFTLAEVATAMTIIGVIAALVMPLVTKSIQKQKSGAVLGRAVEQITLGNQNIIQLANARTLEGGYANTLSTVTKRNLGIGNDNTSIISDLRNIIPPYWGVIQIENAAGNDGNETKYAFSKFPAEVSISGGANVQAGEFPVTGYSITIDTNGFNNVPNQAGIDVFDFLLLNDGTLSPITGTEAGEKAEEVINNGFRIR